jgi:ribosomal protein L13
MYAIFQLEKIIVPGRLSSTVAVNRHAQFKPHLDTGSGTGQSNH